MNPRPRADTPVYGLSEDPNDRMRALIELLMSGKTVRDRQLEGGAIGEGEYDTPTGGVPGTADQNEIIQPLMGSPFFKGDQHLPNDPMRQWFGGTTTNASTGWGSALSAALGSKGRDGDNMVAHINPIEAAVLKAMGGSGTINPKTGLLEFAGGGGYHGASDGIAATSIGDVDPAIAQQIRDLFASQYGGQQNATDADVIAYNNRFGGDTGAITSDLQDSDLYKQQHQATAPTIDHFTPGTTTPAAGYSAADVANLYGQDLHRAGTQDELNWWVQQGAGHDLDWLRQQIGNSPEAKSFTTPATTNTTNTASGGQVTTLGTPTNGTPVDNGPFHWAAGTPTKISDFDPNLVSLMRTGYDRFLGRSADDAGLLVQLQRAYNTPGNETLGDIEKWFASSL